MTNVHKIHLLHTEVWLLSQGKTFVGLSELQVEQATFIEHHFYSKECLTNYDYSDIGIWKIFSWKWKRSELSLQGKPLVEFIANDTIQASKNQIFRKYVFATVSLTASQKWKTFLIRLLVILTGDFFGHCKIKCVTIRSVKFC